MVDWIRSAFIMLCGAIRGEPPGITIPIYQVRLPPQAHRKAGCCHLSRQKVADSPHPSHRGWAKATQADGAMVLPAWPAPPREKAGRDRRGMDKPRCRCGVL